LCQWRRDRNVLAPAVGILLSIVVSLACTANLY
jgi:hypothetical protein